MSLFLILYLAVFGGSIGVFIKLSLTAFTPLTLVFLRATIAALFLLGLLSWRGQLGDFFRIIKTRFWPWLWLGLLGIVTTMTMGFAGIKLTTAIHYDLIFNLSAFFIIIFAALILNERPQKLDITLFILALMGAAIIIFGNATGISEPANTTAIIGDLLILGAAISWALYSVLGIHYLRKESGWRTLYLTTASFLAGAILLLPIVMWQPSWGIDRQAINWITILSLLGLAIFATAILFYVWFIFIKKYGGVWAAIVSLSENIGGVAFPIIILGERLTPTIIIGGALIIAAIVLKEYFERKHQHTHT